MFTFLITTGYAEMGRYLNQTGRPIVYSCSWPAYEEPLGIEVLPSSHDSECIQYFILVELHSFGGNV